ncbi:recombination protein Rad52 [Coemansia reversa NRRL 1564]|uniref:Recombination protein Rad52 n=1 Tax=Coemansia reversa (strain ATCC 12441 / NRRL 1564) TaxID=763665 RepID=A0A2G5BJW3_COERN|nr:recombination protein Rad52 [Coemansia reversa NRRL 1564]|eukprot:PIA19281.1 recombination protein Rad52 [Coemansia reversa NRRL 1564]
MSQFPSAQSRPEQYSAHSEPFQTDDAERVQSLLRRKLGPEHISTRQGMGGMRLSYIEGWRIISIANEIFGFNGWRSSIQSLNVDFMDMMEGGKFNVGASCIVRITLKDGTYREDVGFGMIENVRSKGQALEKVKKEATTDGLKRAMRQFGNVLGNCVYDKEYVKNVTQVQKQPRGRISGDSLFRYSDLENRRDQEFQHSSTNDNGDSSSNSRPTATTANRPQNASNAVSAAPTTRPAGMHVDDGMDFDMGGLDDVGMLGMIEDLETHRPVIFESPTFSYATSLVEQNNQRQQQQQQTPIRPSGGGNGASTGNTNPEATPVNTTSNSAAGSSNGNGLIRTSRIAVDGMPTSARNLSFRPPQPPGDSSTPSRPRSFADVTPFVPSSGGAQPSHPAKRSCM